VKTKQSLIILILVILVFSLYLYGRIAVYPSLKNRHFEMLLNPNYVFLLLGVDHQRGKARSDTMLLLHADCANRCVDVVSLPRDTRVILPGKGARKLGHAYAHGGLDLARDTVQRLTGVDIDYTVVVDIFGFEEIVDLLGGVTVEIERDMQYVDRSQGLRIDLRAGLQHLSGTESMQYVRFRDRRMGDLGRLKRQQKFLSEMKKKFQGPIHLNTLRKLLQSIMTNVNTDLSLATMLYLVNHFRVIDRSRIRFRTLKGIAEYEDGVSFYFPDGKDIVRMRHLIRTARRRGWCVLSNNSEQH